MMPCSEVWHRIDWFRSSRAAGENTSNFSLYTHQSQRMITRVGASQEAMQSYGARNDFGGSESTTHLYQPFEEVKAIGVTLQSPSSASLAILPSKFFRNKETIVPSDSLDS